MRDRASPATLRASEAIGYSTTNHTNTTNGPCEPKARFALPRNASEMANRFAVLQSAFVVFVWFVVPFRGVATGAAPKGSRDPTSDLDAHPS
jgi:hypothetical protein